MTKIWLIEDNQLHAIFFKYVCKNYNIEYKIFTSSQELFSHLENLKEEEIPDIVFIDLVLEDKVRGEDILQELKKRFSDKEVKYIAFTADIVSKKKLKQQGFYEIIYKPINKAKLNKIIKELINELSNSERKLK